MSNLFYYCHICGTITDRSELYRLVERPHVTKKRHTLYQVCGKCLHKLSYRRFKMPILKAKEVPEYTRIFAEPMAKGKSVQLYDVLPEQLEKIKALDIPKEKLQLKTTDNRRVWTVYNVRNLIETNTVEMLKLMRKLFDYQTEDEQVSRTTKWQNAVGFNQADAGFLTGMSRIYDSTGKFTDGQISGIRKRMLKYAQQITILLNA